MKKKLIITLLALVCTLCCAFSLAACVDGGNSGKQENKHVHNYLWIDNGDGTHEQNCLNGGCDNPVKNTEQHRFVPYGEDAVRCEVCGAIDGNHDYGQEHKHNFEYKDLGEKHRKTCTGCPYYEEEVHSPQNGNICECGKDLSKEELQYTLINDTYYEVTGIGTFKGSAVVIPDEYNGLPVRSIGQGAFYSLKTLTSVVIGDNVSSIGYNAFQSCSHLVSVTIGREVSDFTAGGNKIVEIFNKSENFEINGANKSQFPALISIVSEGESKIATDENGFVTYDGSLLIDYIGDETDVTVPAHLTNINASAFAYLYRLESVTLPEGLSEIKQNTFVDCLRLKSVKIPEGVTAIGDGAFGICEKLSDAVLPKSLTKIGEMAFRSCGSLTEAVIGENVTQVGKEAFSSCARLETVIYNAENCTDYGSNIFDRCVNIKNLYVGNKVKSIPNNLGVWSIENVYWDSEVYEAKDGKSALKNFLKLENVYFGETIKAVPEYAFAGCTHITKVVIAPQISVINFYAFKDCTSLTTVVLGSGIKFIYAPFNGCNTLTEVYYEGSAEDFDKIITDTVPGGNPDGIEQLTNAKIYYYSESEPKLNEEETDYDGNYWHYVDGVTPVIWTKES